MVRKLDHVNKSHTPGEIMKMTAASAAAAASSFMAGLDPALLLGRPAGVRAEI